MALNKSLIGEVLRIEKLESVPPKRNGHRGAPWREGDHAEEHHH